MTTRNRAERPLVARKAAPRGTLMFCASLFLCTLTIFGSKILLFNNGQAVEGCKAPQIRNLCVLTPNFIRDSTAFFESP